MNIEHRRVHVGRLELHIAELGAGPAVLLLHGFPAYWADWRGQMQALAASGFRAIALDLPGYGQSEQLSHVRDYALELLAADLAGLISALGLPKVHVIGHDWGGILAYALASRHPELVERLIVINAPHPTLFVQALRRFDQLRRSWYVLVFQLPWLPEWIVRRHWIMFLCLRGMAVRSGAFSPDDVARYLLAMRTPGVARGALSYYRAGFRARSAGPWLVAQRTLILWGEQDHALSAELLLRDLALHVPDVKIVRFADAGHWLHHDLPEVVSRHLIEFLSVSAKS